MLHTGWNKVKKRWGKFNSRTWRKHLRLTWRHLHDWHCQWIAFICTDKQTDRLPRMHTLSTLLLWICIYSVLYCITLLILCK